jgi:glycosyltransferase involved in cell wall biosynthesis
LIVAIDTQFLSKRLRHTGTGAYLYGVLTECLRLAEREARSIEFHGFAAPQDDWVDNGFCSPRMRIHRTRLLSVGRAWRLGGMAVSASLAFPDLVFLPTALGAIPGPFIPLVSTILDAMPKRLPPEMVEVGLSARYITWINAKLAKKVITISEWSKRDLVEAYGLAPERIQVTYLGYDKGLYNESLPDGDASATLLARFGIRRPFVLHHGMVQVRKNVHRLIQAWDSVMDRYKSFDAQLVLAGPMGLGHELILRVLQSSRNRRQIIVTGALPDSELVLLVKNASLCVIPSLYEGFCLPMVEAMACGVPTVASKSSCIPEVSGGVLEYFDPHSIEEMEETVRRALEDSELRNRLRSLGLTRAAYFSWERCARETLNIFTETHEQHGRKQPTSRGS